MIRCGYGGEGNCSGVGGAKTLQESKGKPALPDAQGKQVRKGFLEHVPVPPAAFAFLAVHPTLLCA
jgi:hypothetical protein